MAPAIRLALDMLIVEDTTRSVHPPLALLNHVRQLVREELFALHGKYIGAFAQDKVFAGGVRDRVHGLCRGGGMIVVMHAHPAETEGKARFE